MSFYRQLLFLAGLGVVLVAVLGLRVAPAVLGKASLPVQTSAPKAAAARVLCVEWGPPGNSRKARLEAMRTHQGATPLTFEDAANGDDPR